MTQPIISLFSPDVRDQTYNSCASESLYSAVYTMTAQTGAPKHMALYQNYGDSRWAAGTFYQDSGTGVLGNLESLRQGQIKGLADAYLFPNVDSNMYVIPGPEVYANAASFKIETYRSLNPSASSATFVKNIKAELDAGKPVIAVLKTLAGVTTHVVTIEGTDDATQSYIFKNSWGTDWGTNGYGKLNYSANTNFMGVYVIDKMGGMDFTYSAERKSIASLYAGVLDRPSELEGLDFWAGIKQSGWTDAQIAQALINSPEGVALYGADTNAQFIDDMYDNLMGRDPDQAGLDYFVGLLDNGTSRGSIMASTINHLVQNTRSDSALMVNKTSVAMYYGVAMQIDGSHYDVAVDALDPVTTNINSVEIAKIGIAQDMGFL